MRHETLVSKGLTYGQAFMTAKSKVITSSDRFELKGTYEYHGRNYDYTIIAIIADSEKIISVANTDRVIEVLIKEVA